MAVLRLSVLLPPVLFLTLVTAACKGAPGATAEAPARGGTPAPDGVAAAGGFAPDAKTLSGTVVETMNSGGYTYARLAAGGTDVWIAANEFPVAPGEHLTVAVDMSMENFHSKTLNRDFPAIYFVSRVAREGEALPAAGGPRGAPAMARSHGASPGQSPSAPEVKPTAPPPRGHAIADVWARRDALAGTAVVVRGTVVKVNNGIMNRNWFHLRDGSGAATDGTNDLTVTSEANVNVGDVVTVSGILATKKDFGAGYAYDVILENATIAAK